MPPSQRWLPSIYTQSGERGWFSNQYPLEDGYSRNGLSRGLLRVSYPLCHGEVLAWVIDDIENHSE